ncbi:MAG: hypothetical protein ABL908_04820 [Hyphomicrobium sp.]
MLNIPKILFEGGEDAAIEAIASIRDWRSEELSKLMLELASIGFNRWPTLLVKLGANVNHIGSQGETAISQCIHGEKINRRGQRDPTFCTAIEFLYLGANPNALYMSEYSMLELSLECDRPEFAALLLASGATLTKSIRVCYESSGLTWAKHIVDVWDRGQLEKAP